MSNQGENRERIRQYKYRKKNKQYIIRPSIILSNTMWSVFTDVHMRLVYKPLFCYNILLILWKMNEKIINLYHNWLIYNFIHSFKILQLLPSDFRRLNQFIDDSYNCHYRETNRKEHIIVLACTYITLIAFGLCFLTLLFVKSGNRDCFDLLKIKRSLIDASET